ncbi:hypothetical protein ABT160_23825 [Streptomyces sp. NPDC001941]|uniref:hypothetical protein n=1 Tax=Streptomyces sp. NPDC001941 TaxID=3154659 RepID=UPI003320DFA0
MATSRGRRFVAYLESRKNLAGSACGLLGLGLTFTGLAGAYWPVVVAGLYGAGALVAPPDRPGAPRFPTPSEQLDALRADFATLREYLARVELPPAAAEPLGLLDQALERLLDPGPAADGLAGDPGGLHVVGRVIRDDVPEAVDAYVRTRWWERVASGAVTAEDHLARQLRALLGQAVAVAGGLRDAEALRQEAHTRYVEGTTPDAHRPPEP